MIRKIGVFGRTVGLAAGGLALSVQQAYGQTTELVSASASLLVAISALLVAVGALIVFLRLARLLERMEDHFKE
jgi:hypothetical protein